MTKQAGSKVDYARDRERDLMAAYRNYVGSCGHINVPEVFAAIVDMPARRFYVSDVRAAVVMRKMALGDDLRHMRPTKREMFREIHRRVNELARLSPGARLLDVVAKVVYGPAPKFYLSPGSAKVMVYKARKEWYGRKRK